MELSCYDQYNQLVHKFVIYEANIIRIESITNISLDEALKLENIFKNINEAEEVENYFFELITGKTIKQYKKYLLDEYHQFSSRLLKKLLEVSKDDYFSNNVIVNSLESAYFAMICGFILKQNS